MDTTKVSYEALMSSHKAEANSRAIIKAMKWFLDKYHSEISNEFDNIIIQERNKAMKDIISNCQSIPQETKDIALKRLEDELK